MSTNPMLKTMLLRLFAIPALLFLLAGCDKDKVTSPFAVQTETNAKLLSYLEEEGDLINKIPLPLLDASEVYANVSAYLVIDLRSKPAFVQGHIQGAKNIQADSLFAYVKNNYSKFEKVVLVSASGQTAAYYSALLRLAGFSNIYYLNFGMASWNSFFSSVWLASLNKEPEYILLTNTFYKKNAYSPLPEITGNSAGSSMKDFVEARLDALIKEGFDEDYKSYQSKASLTYGYWENNDTLFYTICVGPIMLYSSNPFTTNTYHPMGAVFYQIYPSPSDFRSVTYLQTIPSKKAIAVYSGTGQESAFYTAYLRLLGYDAKSILFGMNNIDYGMLLHSPEISPYAFSPAYINNYPYIIEPATE